MATTIEEQYREACEHDPRLATPLHKGAFILGAQATLECVRQSVPVGSGLAALLLELHRVNEEIGRHIMAAAKIRQIPIASKGEG